MATVHEALGNQLQHGPAAIDLHKTLSALKTSGSGTSDKSGPPTPRRSLLQLQRIYGNRHLQRALGLGRRREGEGEIDPRVEAAIEHKRGGGQALDSSVRLQMEPAFGADFSGVRVHTDAESHSLNQAVSAVAFTTGQDIFFRQSAYDPGSSAGRELLAHELTHVVQQGSVPAVHGKLVLGNPNDSYEQEADSVSRQVGAAVDRAYAVQSESSAGVGSVAVQRQCACGGHAESGGECEECRKKREAASSMAAPAANGLQRFASVSGGATAWIQRRTVCPPGVSPDDGEGCYEVPDETPTDQTSTDTSSSDQAPADQTSADAGTSSGPAPADQTSAADAGAGDGGSTAADAGTGGAPGASAADIPIENLPGTDYDSCVEQTDEDTAKLMDTINTACSVKGAAIALAGGVAGGLVGGPMGAAIGGVAGGMYGAYNYGKCVEEQNAMARTNAKRQKAQCAQKFKK